MTIRKAAALRAQQLCDAQQLSREELAKRLRVSTAEVYSLLSPRRELTLSALERLCRALHVPIVEFFDSELFHAAGQQQD